MQVAISGAGIAGSMAAFLLAEQGHEVTLFEQAQRLEAVGAGIMLQSSGQAALDRFRLLRKVAAESQKLGGLRAVHSNGRPLCNLDFARLGSDYHAFGVNRGTLFQILLDRCRSAGVSIQTGIRIVGLDPESRELRDTRGRSLGTFTFVIAADGSRSQLRSISGLETHVVEYDYAAAWATGPCDYQPNYLYQVVEGTSRLAGLLPIGNGHSSFFWGLRRSEWETLQSANIEEWKHQVRSFIPQAESILDRITDFAQLSFATYRNVAVSEWSTDFVMLLGDAAHATSPHLGQGANLAIEDAVCFADALQREGDFKNACHAFARERTAKLRYYQRLTRFLSPFFQSGNPVLALGRDTTLPWLPRMPLVGREILRTLSGEKSGWLR